jgi:hypothetical protein
MPNTSDLTPCSSTKTLTIEYVTGSIMPAGGYTVKWRVVGSSTWYTVPNNTINPILIPGVPTCYPIEAQLLTDCGNGLEVISTFGVTGQTISSCYTYQFLDNSQYTYTPCGSSNPVTVYNSVDNGNSIPNVCVIEGTVSGGRFTRMDQCLGNQA